MARNSRKEKDVLGTLNVPRDVYWGINTQRAIQNFQISGRRFPKVFIIALANVKKACLTANVELGSIDSVKSKAISRSIDEILAGKHFDQFPVDVFQTGSGTQINMNMNEVLANRANEILGYPRGRKFPIHPNDDVNKSQSSNDVVPTASNLAVLGLLNSKLLPALNSLRKSLKRKVNQFKGIVKVGRTHLQDAVPIPLSMEFEVYERQVILNQQRLKNACNGLYSVPLGGTAVGTGINADKKFGKTAVAHLKAITGFAFHPNPVKAEGIASHSSLAETSAALRLVALSALKMANDIRWMGSGPRAGLEELILPANEPGSSIMPGKVNPTQTEALVQVCLQVIGNDTVISFAEGFCSILDLNTAKPLMTVNILDSIDILANGINSFVEHCLKGIEANVTQIDLQLKRNLMIVTNLVPLIGYDKAAEIAEIASKSGKTIKEVVLEKKLKISGDLDEILDPKKMV